MNIQVLNNSFFEFSEWTKPLSHQDASRVLLGPDATYLFDQNGYCLTPVEKSYAKKNETHVTLRRQEWVIHKDWMASDSTTGPHLNHAGLFERKAFGSGALDQLKEYANQNHLLWKLIQMKPKWGIDVSIDYVDNKGRVFEVFHYEWDGFTHELVNEKKQEIENFVTTTDWGHAAESLWRRRDEWLGLEFFEQSRWKTDFYGLGPEKFKNIIWDMGKN